MKTWDAATWEANFPGILESLEAEGVEISNNVGAIMVDGFLGSVVNAIFASLPLPATKAI